MTNQKHNQSEHNRFFELSPDLLAIIRLDGHFQQINSAFTRSLGYSNSDIFNQHFLKFVHPSDRQKTSTSFAQFAGENSLIQFQNRYRCQNGLYKQLSWNITIDLSEKLIYANIREICQQTLTQKQSEEIWGESILRCLNDDFPLGFYVTDKNNQDILFINKYFCKIWHIEHLEADIKSGKIKNDEIIEECLKLINVEKFITSYKSVDITGNLSLFEDEIPLIDGGIVRRLYGLIKDSNNNYYGRIYIFDNISRTKEIEQALRESDRKLRAIFNQTFQFIGLLTPDGNILEINHPPLDLLVRENQEIMGCPLWDFPYWKNSPEIQNNLKTWLLKANEGEFVRSELTLADDTGHYFTFDFSIKPIQDLNGKVELLIAEARDITKRKKVEEIIRQEKEFSELLINSTIDGIFAVDRNCCYTVWNPGMETISGVSKEQTIGKCPLEIFPFFQEIGEDKFLYAVLAGETVIAKDRPFIFPETGKQGFMEAYYSPLSDTKGNIIGGIGIVRDVTDRKIAQEEIQQQAQIIKHIRGALVVTDLQGNIITWNRGAEQLYGYETAEVLGKNINFLYPQEHQAICKDLAMQPLLEKGEHQLEIKAYKKNREEIYTIVFLSLLKNLEGAISGIIAYSLDITERKLMENKLRNSLSEKEVLLKEVHHRVKNNLQIISSLFYLQSRYIQDEKILQILQDNRDRIHSMALIHEKLYGAETLEKIDFKDYISTLTKNLLTSYNFNKNINLIVNIEPLFFDIDRAIPCGLIINELVSNSLKYAFPDRKDGKITVDFFVTLSNTYEMIISDNGEGFAEAVDFHNKKSLGLRLVYSLVTKQLDGTIEANGYNGAIFKINFK